MDHDRSTGAVDKLQAALNHDFAGPDQNLPPGYIAACRAWYAGLSEAGKRTAEFARIAMAALFCDPRWRGAYSTFKNAVKPLNDVDAIVPTSTRFPVDRAWTS